MTVIRQCAYSCTRWHYGTYYSASAHDFHTGDVRGSDGHRLQVFPAADVSNATQNSLAFVISCEDDATVFISEAEEKVLRWRAADDYNKVVLHPRYDGRCF